MFTGLKRLINTYCWQRFLYVRVVIGMFKNVLFDRFLPKVPPFILFLISLSHTLIYIDINWYISFILMCLFFLSNHTSKIFESLPARHPPGSPNSPCSVTSASVGPTSLLPLTLFRFISIIFYFFKRPLRILSLLPLYVLVLRVEVVQRRWASEHAMRGPQC